MKRNLGRWFLAVILVVLAMFMGCDSGKDTVEKVTGAQAVKQYQKSKEDLEKASDKEAERLNRASEEGDEEDIFGEEAEGE
jgi:hypothetical protein